MADAGLKSLKGMTKLKNLSLAHSRVTDKGLEQLKAMAKVQTLHLTGSLATDAGTKDLMKALPKLKIDR